MDFLLTHTMIRKAKESFDNMCDPEHDASLKLALAFNFAIELVAASIVANMAYSCTPGLWAIPTAVLAFVFWPVFFVYYVLAERSCAAYWT